MPVDPLRTGAIFRLKPSINVGGSASKTDGHGRNQVSRTPPNISMGAYHSTSPDVQIPLSDPSPRHNPAQSAIQRQFDQLYRATPLPMALIHSLGGSTHHTPPYSTPHPIPAPMPPLFMQSPVIIPSPLKPAVYPTYDEPADTYDAPADPYEDEPESPIIAPPPAPPAAKSKPKLQATHEEAPPSASKRRGRSHVDSLQVLFASPLKAASNTNTNTNTTTTKDAQKRVKPAVKKVESDAESVGSRQDRSKRGKSAGDHQPKKAPPVPPPPSSSSSSKKRSANSNRDIESARPFRSREESKRNNRKRKSTEMGKTSSDSVVQPPQKQSQKQQSKQQKQAEKEAEAEENEQAKEKEKEQTQRRRSSDIQQPKARPASAPQPIPADSKEWSEQEIADLYNAHNSFPANDRNFWGKVAKLLQGRTAAECEAQWFKAVKGARQRKQAKKRVALELVSALPNAEEDEERAADKKTKPQKKGRVAVAAAHTDMFTNDQDDLFAQTPMKLMKHDVRTTAVMNIKTPAQLPRPTDDSDAEDDDYDEEEEIDTSWQAKYANRMRRMKKMAPSKRAASVKRVAVPKPVRPGSKLPTKKRKTTAKETVSGSDGTELRVNAAMSPGGTLRTSIKDDDDNDAYIDEFYSESGSDDDGDFL